MIQIALAVFPGVSLDECEAFSLILGRLPDVEFIGVGHTEGLVAGVGGVEHVDRTYDQVTRPDIVVVPGGLGCRRTARDGELARWLRGVEPTCRWLVASSTGSVVVAAAGLLDDRPATTHWLATPLLESYGVVASDERIVESGRVITCEGSVTAVDVALLLAARIAGGDVARRIRDEARRSDARPPRVPPRPPRHRSVRDGTRARDHWWTGFRHRRARLGPRRPGNPELTVSDWVEMELVEMDVADPDARRSSRGERR